jgi:hypothetical protein
MDEFCDYCEDGGNRGEEEEGMNVTLNQCQALQKTMLLTKLFNHSFICTEWLSVINRTF